MMSGPMKALLGALAVAGYQNRDKIAEVLRGLQNRQPQDARHLARTTRRMVGWVVSSVAKAVLETCSEASQPAAS